MSVVKISIIIPVFNDEKHLHQCLSSLVNQSLKDLEIICLNDGSTDSSEEIIKEFMAEDDRVKYYSMGKNLGSGLARNKGLENAIGEYVSFVDSDDHVLGHEVYEELYKFAHKKNADMVSANLKSFNNNGEYYLNNFCDEYTEEVPILPQDYGIPWFHQKNIYKRKFLNEHNIDYPDYKRGQDPVFLAKVLKNIDIIFCLPIDFYAYRALSTKKINSGAKEFDYIKHFYDVLEILDINTFKETHLKYEERLFYYFSAPNLFYSTESLEWSVIKIFGENSRTHKIYKMYKSLIWKEKVNNQLKETILIKEKENNQLKETILNKELENNRLKEGILNKEDNIPSRSNIKSNQISQIGETNLKMESNRLNSQIKYIFEDFYETLFRENIGRPLTQKIWSNFPSMYFILKRDNSIKNAFINIKGYHSIKKNKFLDIGSYLRNYPEVRKSGKDPILHYIVNGYKESRIPHPSFDYKYYTSQNKDVKDSNLNPLVHYSLYGQKEKRKARKNLEININTVNIFESTVHKKTVIELIFDYPVKFDNNLIKLENNEKTLIPIDLKLFRNRILVVPLKSLVETEEYTLTLLPNSITDMFNYPISHHSFIFSFNKLSKHFELENKKYEYNASDLTLKDNEIKDKKISYTPKISELINSNKLKVHPKVNINISDKSSLILNSSLEIGRAYEGQPCSDTSLRIFENATLLVQNDFKIHTGANITVYPNAMLKLGSGYINHNVKIDCNTSITIGNHVFIASDVIIKDVDGHIINNKSENESKPIIIEDNVRIADRAIILKGVTIGSGSVVAEGSVVNKDVPKNCMVAGVPAKVKKENIEWD